jgi:hypothetical protein
MQATKATGITQKTTAARGNPFKGNIDQGKNGIPKAGTDDASFSGAGLHLLTKGVRSIPLFEAELMFGPDDDDSKQILAMVNTEEKQLQAIEDLYAIVKAQPRYKKLKDPNWSPETKPLTVLVWILRKLGPLAEGNRWTVDTFMEGTKTRYRYVTYEYFSSQYVPSEEYHVCLDFLPYLKKRDPLLHDMIVDVVALVSRHNKIPLWDEDGDFSAAMEQLLSEPDRYKDYGMLGVQRDTAKDRQRMIYRTGPAAQYLQLIKSRRRRIKAADIWKQISAYRSKNLSQRKNVLVWWIRFGIQIANTSRNIQQFSYVPNYLQWRNRVISPFRLYKFLWSRHKNDYVSTIANNQLRRDDGLGLFVPVLYSVAMPGQVLKKIKPDTFPHWLCQFMRRGDGCFTRSYSDYFYGKQLEAQLTPAERLLEDIAANEIKQQQKNDRRKNKSKIKSKAGHHRVSR